MKIVAIILLCLILVGAVACRPLRRGEKEEEFPSDLVVSVSGSGSVDITNQAKLSFNNGGEKSSTYVEEGNMVSKGQVLAILSSLDREALELAVT